jgi:tetratricopeptide (TPR) repeat protein
VGEAWDPQNWRPINDHELAALADGFREKATYAASRDDLLMAALFEKRGNPILAAKAYESAVAVCPQLPDAWEARSAYLERTQAPTSVRKAFHESALKQFQTQRDLRVRHQAALAAIAREEGDITTAETIEKQIVTNNRRTRSDLSINAAARRLTTLLENKKTSEALSEYRKLLTSLKKTGGGNFFYEIVVPFANALKDEGETTHAIEAVQLAQKALNPEAGSILDQEFGTLLKDLSVKSTE